MRLIDWDKWLEIYHSLAKNPLRTILTALGVFWGIFMLVIMIGSGQGLQNSIINDFSGVAPNSLFLWSQSTSKPYKGLPVGRGFEMNLDDYRALLQSIPEAKVITPRNQLGGFQGNNQVTRGNKYGTFNVMGDFPEIQIIQPMRLLNGRFLNPLDMKDRRKVAVIGLRVRQLLFENEEEPLGKYIRINGVYFKVVGVFNSLQSGERGLQETERIYIPFTAFQQAFNFGNEVGWFTMNARDGYKTSMVKDKALAILKKRHKVHPEDTRAFGYFNLEEEFDKVQNLFQGINAIIWIVGTMTLLAGVIGISNIMLVIVKERTKEIGIRRALGATPYHIISQIITESVVLTGIAGYVGMLCGMLLLEGVNIAIEGNNDVAMQDPGIDVQTALWALTIIVVSGILAGLIPARRAVDLKPVDALRAE